ncbi:DUF4261 domain-containing protein [Bremerella alba]|uniref:DUF4261 domain-containing protein n=1 Tax=Bremerella alba TaxID=980252 RepID=A0A7V8V598_9BACT|nr:DUF4261 domain-containing protein [Bremerella alba]MBA2115031.1 hypothetical protein [Bremerella alba]
MAKGIFTQGVCVLVDRPISIEQIALALSDFDVLGTREDSEEWAMGGPSALVMFDETTGGTVTVDTVDHVWPDDMGDPQKEIMVFGAWSMGHFGPFAYPGGLQRAAQQSWGWREGAEVVERHQAFLRLRTSYVIGKEEDTNCFPEPYDPIAELQFNMKIVEALLGMEGTLCYFNPNGEILLDQDGFRNSLNFSWANELLPLDVWSNVRLFNIDESWALMDTVGNWQLEIPDIEACFVTDDYEVNEVANFLRNASNYLVQSGATINDGETMDGPGDIHWAAIQFENGICDPPRDTLRFVPLDDHDVPEIVQTSGRSAEEDQTDDETSGD